MVVKYLVLIVYPLMMIGDKMDIFLLIVLASIIVGYPIIKIDQYFTNKNIRLSENRLIFSIQYIVSILLIISWLIIGCKIAFEILEFIGL